MLLFNLENDCTEENELSGEYPEIVKRLESEYEIFKYSLL
jgi:hypothetical protein